MLVFLIGYPMIDDDVMNDYLDHIGAEVGWLEDKVGQYIRSDASDAEMLVEVMARSCYMSFGTELNDNISKVRDSSAAYLENILESQHGSVLEHGMFNFQICDVSRTFTHELVRHRAGTAISQESLRYVRRNFQHLTPQIICENEEAFTIYDEGMDQIFRMKVDLDKALGIDTEKDFNRKKKLSSASRAMLPHGVLTHIGWSANIRALRWCIENRTNRHAEIEIREAFAEIGRVMMKKCPFLFGDFEGEEIDGIMEWTPKYRKV